MPPTTGKKSSGDLSKNILSQLLAKEENKACADCSGRGPRWASWNLGVILCIRCSGLHRSLGVHISRVKSITLDSWTVEQLQSICSRGNGWAKETYEANLPQGFKRPEKDLDVEYFIRDKYDKKKYISSTNVPLRSLSEFEGLKSKSSKESLANKQDVNGNLANGKNLDSAIPRPKSSSNRSSTQPQAAPPPAVNAGAPVQHAPKSSLDDLLGLQTSPPPTSQPHSQGNNVFFDVFPSQQMPQQQSQQQPQQQPQQHPHPNPFMSNEIPVQAQPQQPQVPTPGPQPMSKDTILSLYSHTNPSAMQQNPYMMPGAYSNQPMMGFPAYQPQQMMPGNMAYPAMPAAMPSGFTQPVNQQAAQQLQWQQQQLQQRMQGMYIQPNTMQMPPHAPPQVHQVPAPNMFSQSFYANPTGGGNVPPQPPNNTWQAPVAQRGKSQTLSADLWK